MDRSRKRFHVWLSLMVMTLALAGCSKSPIDRAQAFLDAGMGAQAVPLLQLEIQSNPKNARAHLLLGEALLTGGDAAGAKESFDRAVLLNPGAREQVGKAYFDVGSRLAGKSGEELHIGLQYLDAAHQQTHAFDKPIARIYRRVGLEQQAAVLLESAVKLDPSLAADDSLSAMDALWRQDGDRQTILRAYLTEHPQSALRAGALEELAKYAIATGNLTEATGFAQQVLASSQNPQVQAAGKTLLADIAAAGVNKERAAVAEAQLNRQQAALAQQRQTAELQTRQDQERSAALQRTNAAQAQARDAAAQRERMEWESWKQSHRVMARISNTHGGFAKIFVNDRASENGQVVTSTESSHPRFDSGWVDVTDRVNKGQNEFRFRARCNHCTTFGADFEVKVGEETVLTRHAEQAGTYEEAVMVTLPR